MKLFVKAAAVLLCLCMLFCGVSCAGSGEEAAPAGMKIATAVGADYRFYIPSYWNVNMAYGVSGGYYSMAAQSTASMEKYPMTADMREQMNAAITAGEASGSIAWFWNAYCIEPLRSYAQAQTVEHLTGEDADVLLGTLNAKQYHCKATVNGTGKELHFVQVVGESADAFYLLTCIVEDSLYAARQEDIALMMQHFNPTAEAYRPDSYLKPLDTSAPAPEGMKLASGDEVAYRFYVPTDWSINRDEEIFAAYVEGDRSSVSVVPYQPTVDGMGVDAYFAMCEEMMRNTAGQDGYSRLSEPTETTLGGKKAKVYEYTYRVGGIEYQYKQVVTYYRGMIYNLTYTARPENYGAHVADVDAMIAAFVFR